MTKHIAGLILFSFIVGFAIIISAATDTTPSVVRTREYRLTKKKKRKRHHCRHHRRNMGRVALENAVFNKSTGLFSTNLGFEKSRMAGYIDFHFYAHDRFGTRYLKTERLAYAGKDVTYSKELKWMKFLDPDQELFVIAANSYAWSDETTPPEFDQSKAIPVLIND